MAGSDADRQERLAAALRQNLKRRKAAARTREAPAETRPDDAPSPPAPSDRDDDTR